MLQEALHSLTLSDNVLAQQTPTVLMAANSNNPQQPVKVVKPPPFYVTIIVGKYLVHNCMIDLGATSSVMPKKIVDQLGLKYEPIEKGVVQLDGTAIETVGVIRNMDLTLHACPSFSVPMDIYIIDLPPYFSICLSRDFTAKIGGYVSADWSHMLCRTRYGTKVTIPSEPIAKECLELNIAAIENNTAAVLFDQEEVDVVCESETPIDTIPDVLLDEWAIENAENSESQVEEPSLGNYVIHESTDFLPNVMKNTNLNAGQ